MFGISGPEFLFILLVALIVIGPRDLPRALLQLGRMVRLLRRKAEELQSEARGMVRELELDELRTEVEQAIHQAEGAVEKDVRAAGAWLDDEAGRPRAEIEQAERTVSELVDDGIREDLGSEPTRVPPDRDVLSPSGRSAPAATGERGVPG